MQSRGAIKVNKRYETVMIIDFRVGIKIRIFR